jgi:hypothetical protein
MDQQQGGTVGEKQQNGDGLAKVHRRFCFSALWFSGIGCDGLHSAIDVTFRITNYE